MCVSGRGLIHWILGRRGGVPDYDPYTESRSVMSADIGSVWLSVYMQLNAEKILEYIVTLCMLNFNMLYWIICTPKPNKLSGQWSIVNDIVCHAVSRGLVPLSGIHTQSKTPPGWLGSLRETIIPVMHASKFVIIGLQHWPSIGVPCLHHDKS